MSGAESVIPVLRNVLPASVDVEIGDRQGRDVEVVIAGSTLRVRRLDRGWPRQVREALRLVPRPDVLVAPTMSPGARAVAAEAGVGWADEMGAAEIVVGPIVVSRSGVPAREAPGPSRWTAGVQAVVEALLIGTRATVSAVVDRTGLSAGTATKALKLLTSEGWLAADAERGRGSARRVVDADRLLDAYAEHVAAQRPGVQVQVGVVWRDPVTDAVRLGEAWTAEGTSWATTSALAAAVLAPAQTQVSPWEIYVAGTTAADLVAAARTVGLAPLEGGRLRLRPFPSPGTAALSTQVDGGLICVPWPRAYADLRTMGVRGEDVAETLRQEMSHG